MRIRSIRITKWRNFEDIELQLNDRANLVCVVGANGTGKSHLLELIAACAHRLGLSPGSELPRGDPFSDEHDFALRFYIAQGINKAIDEDLRAHQLYQQWDRTLTIHHRNLPGNSVAGKIDAGGIKEEAKSIEFAKQVVGRLQASQTVHFLFLDADRAYPKKNVAIHEIAQAYEIDWEAKEYTRGRSFRTSTTLYDEWLKYFLARENQSGTRLMQGMRRAKKQGTPAPQFQDHFEDYASALQKVLPHLFFTGVDSKKRTLLFDTTGLELSFDQLSGGEREIAFLIGQIDRFRLREGLFLLDEPELHLNSDLIRTWVGYLVSTISHGQVWIATHSLEAVEAAGQHATFILERNEDSRKVDSIANLDARPVLSALSRAVGTPAFSISQLVFVFIEGEENVGERERYRRLAGLPHDVRFMECGSCKEVRRRVLAIKALAKEAGTEIHIGGVVDRDLLPDNDIKAIVADGVFALPVHEIENLFLHPSTLTVLVRQHGREGLVPEALIQRAADARAGSWVFQYAMATSNARSLPEIREQSKELAKSLTWSEFNTNRQSAVDSIVNASGYDADARARFEQILLIASNAYARKRDDPGLWKVCEGKQVLNEIARAIGFQDASCLSDATFAVWGDPKNAIPDELVLLREYLASL